MPHYLPATASVWSVRPDANPDEYFYHNILEQDLTKPLSLTAKFALLGFACDLGVQRNYGRAGAKLAPPLIRQFLSRLSIPYHKPCLDCGDIVVKPHANLQEAQQLLNEKVAGLASANIIPIVLGGGHETAYGHYRGLKKAYPQEEIAIVNFDAHFDLREMSDQLGNSGTPFRQIYQETPNLAYYCLGIQPASNTRQLFDFAKLIGCEYLEAHAIHLNPQLALTKIKEILHRHNKIYVSVCLDVFHYSCAPGVSAPQALGLYPQIVIECLRLLAQSAKVCAFDIVEFNPYFDIDNHTARLAAALIYEFFYAYA